MPKRSNQDKIDSYRAKIRRLEIQEHRKRIRVIDSSDSDENSDNELQTVDDAMPTVASEETLLDSAVPDILLVENETPAQDPSNTEETQIPDLDPDVLSALGEAAEDTPKLGEKIHEKLAQLWTPILRKGLEKDAKEKIKKQFSIPENCPLLLAPKLNPEISAAASEATRLKDKRVESVQQQLGQGITALNRGLTLLLDGDKDRVQAIKFLSDSCRLLCDLHYVETEARKKFVTPGLDRSFTNLIQDIDRDDTLFGNKLSERIKASKVIEKQGLQIKKSFPANKTPTAASSSQPSTSRSRYQGNWSGPPRFPANRGGRGASRRSASAGRRAGPWTAPKPAPPSKPRATAQP